MQMYSMFPKKLNLLVLIPSVVLVVFLLLTDTGFGQLAFPEVVPPGAAPIAPVASASVVAAPAIAAPPPVVRSNVAPPAVPVAAPAAALTSAPVANQASFAPIGAEPNRNPAPAGTPPNARTVATQKIQKTHPRSIMDPQHPFAGYYEVPAPTQSAIRGKAIGVSELIENVRSGETRRQLLGDYWELAGLLAEYNMRYDAELRAAKWFQEAEQSNDLSRKSYMIGTFHYLQPQRQATEIAFIKKQHHLAERIRYANGVVLAGDTLPIPCDYPIVKTYETYSDKIAKTERARSLGRLIPIQQQLIGFRRNGQIAAENLLREAMKNPSRFQEQVGTLQQRVDAYVILTGAVVEYNKMIADYALETISPGIDNYRLIGALIELPNYPASPSDLSPEGSRPRIAAPPARQLSTTTPVWGPSEESIPVAPLPLDSFPLANAPLATTPLTDSGTGAYANFHYNPDMPFGATPDSVESLRQPEPGIRQEMVSTNPIADQGAVGRSILYGSRELPDHSVREAGFALPDRGNEVRTIGRSPVGPATIQPVSFDTEEASPK